MPALAYNALTFLNNPVFSQWSAQNLLPSPHPLHYVLAYGPLLLPAISGFRWAWRRARRDMRYALLVGWPVITALLVYLPINVQRRLLEGVIVPLGILAAIGLYRWARLASWGRVHRQRERLWRRYRVALGLVVLPTSLLLLLIGLFATLNPNYPTYRPTGEIAALQWLNGRIVPGEVVLASNLTSNVVPAWVNATLYIGHGPETLNAGAKQAQVDAFYSGTLGQAEADTLLTESRARYIWWGPLERERYDLDVPLWGDKFTLVYDQGGYRIYEVSGSG